MSQNNASGRHGRFGGVFVAEGLVTPLREVAAAFEEASQDEAFLSEYERWLDHRVGRPTPVSHLEALSQNIGGGQLWLKREDLCMSGSFCINLAMHQGLLARRMERTHLIGETATGDFGVALAMVGAMLGLSVQVFLGRDDAADAARAILEMQTYGATVTVVDASHRGRSHARAAALRSWMRSYRETFYCTSLLASPHPYAWMIAEASATIGVETRVQLKRRGCEPDYIIAPVGSGGFAAGLLGEFIDEPGVTRVGVQAGGDADDLKHAASLISGRPGIFHGTKSYVLQDEQGQILPAHSIAPGLCESIVGPQHANWSETSKVLYASIADHEAQEAVARVAREEGILCALEAGHALAYALRLLPTLSPDKNVVVGVSGSGLKDLKKRDG